MRRIRKSSRLVEQRQLERKSQRDLKNAVRHFFGPESDMTPAQIVRLRGRG
jgi:hypothetical protein